LFFAFAVLLAVLLAAIAWIDFRDHIIPDWLNFGLEGAGVVALMVLHSPSYTNAFAGSIGAMVFFLALRAGYQYFRGVQGLGMGDVKFLAASGIWVGATGLPWLVLFASISGLCYILATAVVQRGFNTGTRVAFGPHLSLGLFATWMAIMYGYL
jgi:leader peptidase (prepilin peptidase) / N-methyltransferase